MLRTILEFKNTRELNKNEQKSMNGGKAPEGDCPSGTIWSGPKRCCLSESHGHCH